MTSCVGEYHGEGIAPADGGRELELDELPQRARSRALDASGERGRACLETPAEVEGEVESVLGGLAELRVELPGIHGVFVAAR